MRLGRAVMAAGAAGLGLSWLLRPAGSGPGVRGSDAPAAAVVAAASITGRVVDLEGRPVRGVSVEVGAVRSPRDGDLAPWLQSVREGELPWVASQHLLAARPESDAPAARAATDRDGRFRLDGLRPERVVELRLRGESVAFTAIEVATRPMDPVLAAGFADRHGPGSRTVYGSDFTLAAAPGRAVVGVLTDAGTGRPLPGVGIRSYRFAGSDILGVIDIGTRTDAEGRFRLAGLPKGPGNVLVAVPGDDAPYFLQEIAVPDPPGLGPVAVGAALRRGVRLEGRLTERATGAPVVGARVHYFPFAGNARAREHPAFRGAGSADGYVYRDRYVTGADGRFRLVGLPGRGIVGAEAEGSGYLPGGGAEAIAGLGPTGDFATYRNPGAPGRLWPTAMREINPPEGAEVVRVDLQVVTDPKARPEAAAGRTPASGAAGGLGGPPG